MGQPVNYRRLDKIMDNFSDSEFTLVLCVFTERSKTRKLKNIIEYHREIQREMKNPFLKKKWFSLVQRL